MRQGRSLFAQQVCRGGGREEFPCGKMSVSVFGSFLIRAILLYSVSAFRAFSTFGSTEFSVREATRVAKEHWERA